MGILYPRPSLTTSDKKRALWWFRAVTPRTRDKHPLWIRWLHWINFPLLGLMVWSGILIYWANDVYGPFFPQWFYNLFGLDHQLALGMAIHFAFAWLFTLNGL